jgi:hypothetical protein
MRAESLGLLNLIICGPKTGPLALTPLTAGCRSRQPVVGRGGQSMRASWGFFILVGEEEQK